MTPTGALLVALPLGTALAVVARGRCTPARPPVAPVRPVAETLNGVTVVDPYR